MAKKTQFPGRQLAFDFALPELTYKLKAYWQAAVARVGAASIEEAIAHTYRRTGSVAQTAQTLTFSPTTIRNKLHALREPVKRRGGRNNPYGRKGKPHKSLLPLL